MKNLIYIFLTLTLVYSCNPKTQTDEPTEDTTIEDTGDETSSDISIPVAEPDSTATSESDSDDDSDTDNFHLKSKDLSELKYISTFLPAGHQVLDFEYGDLNRDEHKKDVILAAHSRDKEMEQLDTDRPLIILTRQADGKLKKEGRNDGVVMCYDCGGVMGDPYQDIAIKNGYFSIEHYGGSSWRWTSITTFKYDDTKKKWFLHKKGGVNFHSSNPEEIEEDVATTKDFGVVEFKDFKDDF